MQQHILLQSRRLHGLNPVYAPFRANESVCGEIPTVLFVGWLNEMTDVFLLPSPEPSSK
jgi:hypothetical protein